jgi:chemotaxis signal transduction protein
MSESVEVRAPQYLSFMIRGTDYGLPILTVKEILQHEQPTPVPGAPSSIRGVINVRGAVVPVVDLAVKFGRGETVATNRTCILVVEPRVAGERLTVGVLADAVNEVLDLPSDSIEPPPAFGTNVKLDYLTGMGKVGKGFVLLLDVDRVVSASEAELVTQAAVELPQEATPAPAEAAEAPPPAAPPAVEAARAEGAAPAA